MLKLANMSETKSWEDPCELALGRFSTLSLKLWGIIVFFLIYFISPS